MFLWCECPRCAFSVVLNQDVIGDLVVACPICESRAKRLVVMDSREATDADIPQGLDARMKKTSRFTCADCGQEGMSQWTDEEAAKEFELMHGRPPGPMEGRICDKCFRRMHGAGGRPN